MDSRNDDCEWQFPWKDVAASFEAQSGPHRFHHYKLRNGQPLSETLGAQAERIEVGHSTEIHQETTSFIYHCYEGNGRTIITPQQGEQVTVEWASKDTWAVPAWSKIQHINEGSEPAYLFAINDRPWMTNLGLFRSA